jgi:purine-binding chemotaxis protein CheW
MSIATSTGKRGARIRNTADKHLGLMLGTELLVVPILAIQEIVGHQEITPVPRMPAHVRGVINLRGRVLAVVDLRIRLGLEPVPPTKRTCIVVAQVPGAEDQVTMGLLVDQVTEVLDIPKDHIDAAPDLGGSIDRRHLTGIARIGQKVAMVIDLPRLLGPPPAVGTAQPAPVGG